MIFVLVLCFITIYGKVLMNADLTNSKTNGELDGFQIQQNIIDEINEQDRHQKNLPNIFESPAGLQDDVQLFQQKLHAIQHRLRFYVSTSKNSESNSSPILPSDTTDNNLFGQINGQKDFEEQDETTKLIETEELQRQKQKEEKEKEKQKEREEKQKKKEEKEKETQRQREEREREKQKKREDKQNKKDKKEKEKQKKQRTEEN
ncbi:unnamed protein product [Rotaria socialis]|uniref:Uncharacterized protein n=1 Tax=Rotaria socialis TaxID=392032 RepID=A0A817SJU8_9BILA|nr:unnamed protein product [Rotaria socialis]